MFFQDLNGLLEFFIFFICQVEFNDVLYTVLTDLDRNGSKAVLDSIRAVEVDGAGENLVLIMVNGTDKLSCCRRNTELVQPFMEFSQVPSS